MLVFFWGCRVLVGFFDWLYMRAEDEQRRRRREQRSQAQQQGKTRSGVTCCQSVGMVSAPRPPLPPASYERAPRKGPLHRGGGGGAKVLDSGRGGTGELRWLRVVYLLYACYLLLPALELTDGRNERNGD